MKRNEFEIFLEVAKELKVEMNMEIIERCYSLLESGVSMENMIMMYDEIRNEFDE
jgi:hypothetical protein